MLFLCCLCFTSLVSAARMSHPGLSWILGRVVRKPVNANPGLKVSQSVNFLWIKMFFTAYVSCSFEVIRIQNWRTNNMKSKLKSKFSLILGYLNVGLWTTQPWFEHSGVVIETNTLLSSYRSPGDQATLHVRKEPIFCHRNGVTTGEGWICHNAGIFRGICRWYERNVQSVLWIQEWHWIVSF